MSESEELLFFDTFAHGTTEELNLDLVQFPKPVYINQVRVIPLGAKVQADFPGGVRLGATNPSQFKLELFVNDLSKPGASAFETLGVLDYNQNSNIHYDSDRKVPTDGLVLRGWYTTVTLAVYGVITRAPIISIPPPPPAAPIKPASPVPDEPTQPPVPELTSVITSQITDEKLRTSTPPFEEKSDLIKCENAFVSTAPVVESEVKREIEPEKETKVKVEEKIVEKVREKSRRSDEFTRTRDSSEFRERDWECDRVSKVDSERSNRSDHRSRHDVDRSKIDSDRIRSDSDRHRADSDRNRTEPDRNKTDSDREKGKMELDRKRGESERTKSERSDSDRTRSDPERTRSDPERAKNELDRVKSDVSRNRIDSERTRVDKNDSNRPRSDSDRVKCDPDRVKGDSDRARTDERARSDRDREKRGDRSDRKERSKERERSSGGSERDRSRERSRDRHREKDRAKERGSRESSRRPRTPAEDKKPADNVVVPPTPVSVPVEVTPPPPPPPPPPPLTPIKREEPSVECFSPGVEMEAISDDEMPEVDNLIPADEIIDEKVNEIEASDPVELNIDPLVEKEIVSSTDLPVEAAAESVHEPEELEELEEILSDEDLMFEDYNADITDLDLNEFGELFEIGKTFNPYNFELQPLQILSDPSNTILQRISKGLSESRIPCSELEDAALRLQTILELTSRGEKWIDGMNHLASILPNALAFLHLQPDLLQSVQDKLVEWLIYGLDFDSAREQPGPSTHTVRHIKCGLKLSQAVAQCSESLVERSVDRGLLTKIASLYRAPHMAQSLKLMCLRSLDALLYWPYVMEHWRKKPVLEFANGYQYLIQLIEETQPSRAQVTVTALIRKIHTYESLERIHNVGQILARLPPSGFRRKDIRRPSGMSIESQDSNSQDSFSTTPACPPVSAENPLEPHLTQLLSSLDQARKVYLNPLLTVGHLVRFLPVYRQYEISNPGSDPLQGIYSFMRHHRFLSVLLLLSTHPLSGSDHVIVDVVLNFLEDFGKTHHGLCFLSSEPEITTLILRALMHTSVSHGHASIGLATEPVEGRHDEYANMEELNVTSHHASMTPHRLGVQLAHALHAIQCLDVLKHHVINNNKDSPAAIECIQSLYSLVFSVTGRLALIHVIALDSNIDVLLNILTSEDDADAESKAKESAVRGYAAELVALVVRSTENAVFYAKYAAELNGLVASNQDDNNKLAHLARWVEILNRPQVFTLDSGLPVLCDVIKQHADDVANFPPELIVALRLLCPLAIPNQQGGSGAEEYVELKYAYAVVQLYSHDILSVLVSMLLKLCQAYEQPAVHEAVLAGPQGFLLLSVVHPSLKLIRRLLCQLIRCRDSEFRDLTAVAVLLQTYAVVSAVPASSLLHYKVTECCTDIIGTLLAYSQPLLQTGDGNSVRNSSTNSVMKISTTPEDAISRSLWTQMVQEIIKYIHSCSGPAAFITGLQVLNEILPLPLPLFRRVGGETQFSEDHVQEILNARKLWSVHLHTLGPQIQQVVRLLCCSGPQLLQLLRKVSVQIADLSASTALVIARAALDAVLSSCLIQDPSPPANAKSEENEKDVAVPFLPVTLVCTAHSARVLNFLAAIVTHPPIKAAVLQLCRGLQKSDEKYSEFLQCLCLILNSVSRTSAHIQSQECVVSIFQSLLDADICLLSPDKVEYESYLSAALPSHEPMVIIISGLWDHLANSEHNYSSLLPTLRTLTLLTEHNYTFQHLHKVLERKRHALWAFFDKMANAFNKDSSDSVSTLSTALELLRTLVKTPAAAGLGRRNITMPIGTLSEALQWPSEPVSIEENVIEEPKKHPLLVLEDFLREHCTEEESMESLRESLSALVKILQSSGSDAIVQKEIPAEISIPLPETLSLQFARRPLLSDTPTDEDRLSSSYWLSNHQHWVDEPGDSDTDHVRCDLLETAQSCLGADVDLMALTESLCRSHTEPMEIGGRATTVTSIKGRIDTRSNDAPPGRPVLSTARDKSSKPYVAPMRGRGFGRPGVNGRNDPFRSRAPNTSRPPSLHVDDFVAMEKNGVGGPSSSSGVGNTLYGTKVTRGGGGRGSGNRGRGFLGERGRFNFQQPRREGTRSRPGGTGSTSSSSAKWEDSYLYPSVTEARSATRFQSTNRVWTNTASKERYSSPSNTAPPAGRTRHTRTFSR